MDESANKGSTGSDAAIPKRREIGRITVTGYDTGLPRGDVKRALRKHFDSCGQITDVYVPIKDRVDYTLWRHGFIYFVGEGAVDKALQLHGSDVGGWNVSVKHLPFLENADNFATVTVRGYDTSLSEINLKSALRKLLSSIGAEITEFMIFKRSAVLSVEGQDVAEKAPELTGSKMGGFPVVVRRDSNLHRSTVHHRPPRGGIRGGRRLQGTKIIGSDTVEVKLLGIRCFKSTQTSSDRKVASRYVKFKLIGSTCLMPFTPSSVKGHRIPGVSTSPQSCNRDLDEKNKMGDTSPRTSVSTDGDTDNLMFDGGHVGDSSDRSKDKLDQKTVRRLAQNREAARKSRLRKKAYVQQLENSRLKLTQLEQELQRARQQGVFISSSGDQAHSTAGNGAMAFDVEYRRWQEDKNRQMKELSSALDAHASDAELRIIVEAVIANYEELFRIKSNAAKSDVFHLLSGMWKTPAERCFLWLGGFRSSELLKLIANKLELLTEQQSQDLNNLQESSQQAEDALSQGMDSLQQSLSDTLSSGTLGSSSSGNVASYMGQMAMAMGKLGTLEGFIRQADNLRLQTYQQMLRILTTRQSARALLAIHEYSLRLRALSSLWLARPRE
ncbi:unnamed protein product [Thlaspi arvense]|uniref:Uncharacterized protein n=1 Tax=Thlaspi arvense TaxID=13288 RepID=A0AAU9SVQ4_THLAR|nr:unnamed protein product [Thlaspi arvense]